MAIFSLPLPVSLLCYLTVFLRVTAQDLTPLEVKWSDSTYGPDGPWPAVEVTLGSDQTIALYPGREFQTFLLTSDYCNGNTTCPASAAHLYNKERGQVDTTGGDSEIQWQPGPDFMSGLEVAGLPATSWIDYMDVGGVTVPNVSLALLNGSYASYPDGTWYPLSVGCLGIGAPGTVNQTFTTSGPAINASLVPGWLREQNQLPSNSFAMHIGSANPAMPGSLYFGGYDQNRIVGDILTEEDDYTKAISLNDIGIRVVDGSSPWDFTSKDGLLAANNNSISAGGIKVSVDGCSPYLTLPKSTCDAIADHLPVKYNKNLGLYIWQQDDAKYSQIVSSASALDFTFLAGSNTKHVTISVPFRHLNLTLTQPLVDTDQQYFPCYTGSTNGYTLGRAFLQDAFVGANWDAKKWWLAQAPGPNIPTAEVITLNGNDTDITASSNDWEESWSGSWKALTTDDIQSSQTVSLPGVTSTPGTDSSSSSSGLSTGAAAGIGVGVGVAALAIIGGVVFFLFRRRKAAKAEPPASTDGTPDVSHATPAGSYHPANGTPQQGYYAPVKNHSPASPNMPTTYSHNLNPADPSVYGQQVPQHYPYGYAQPYTQQYTQAAELATDNHPSELAGPEMYNHPAAQGPQPTHDGQLHSPNQHT